ncbi:MAG: metal ABC transporter solute-binding protein, Zn/Mn family [Phycisphaerales bacterium JB040]
MHLFRILTLLLLVVLPGCTPADGEAGSVGDETRLTVVCTTGMIADVVRGVGGDGVMVDALMGPGTDPHLYQPTRSDLAAILDADVVFYNGLNLEGRMSDALERARGSGRRVVAVAESIDESGLLASADYVDAHDPHVWMDPTLWLEVIDAVHATLVEADPDRVELFDRQRAGYRARVEGVHAYAQEVLATVPEGSRVLVSAHDAFHYFGERYGFEVVGIQGISTESEAGVRDIERLVGLLVERNIPAVFVETTVSDRNINALIEGARARGHSVAIGGSLFSDAMGPEGAYTGRYAGMLDHNVTTIARALGGRAPSGGMSGELVP